MFRQVAVSNTKLVHDISVPIAIINANEEPATGHIGVVPVVKKHERNVQYIFFI